LPDSVAFPATRAVAVGDGKKSSPAGSDPPSSPAFFFGPSSSSSSPPSDHENGAVPPFTVTLPSNGRSTLHPAGESFPSDGGTFTRQSRLRLPVAWTVSRARTVKENVPAFSGVPASVPSSDSETPSGSAPAESDQVIAPVPPDAKSRVLTLTSRVQAGGSPDATETGGLIVMETRCVSRFPSASATAIVNEYRPDSSGVPPKTPSAPRRSPGGSVPAETDQVRAPVPPWATCVC